MCIRDRAVANAEVSGKIPFEWYDKLNEKFDLSGLSQIVNEPTATYSSTLEILKNQLKIKDDQISELNKHISELTGQVTGMIKILSSKLIIE